MGHSQVGGWYNQLDAMTAALADMAQGALTAESPRVALEQHAEAESILALGQKLSSF